jgi:phage-related protein
MKPVIFLGDNRKRIISFPKSAKRRIGAELFLLEQGEQPEDFKPMPSVGRGVEELRVRDDRSNAYRVIYIARLRDAVFVLHAFEKKTQATSLADIRLAKARLQLILGDS